jgi:hypothetical protein
MKNTLAENMRRFRTKNLGVINEQGVVPPSLATGDQSTGPEMEQLENEVLNADINDPNPLYKLVEFLKKTNKDIGKYFQGLVTKVSKQPNLGGPQASKELCDYYDKHAPSLPKKGINISNNISNWIRNYRNHLSKLISHTSAMKSKDLPPPAYNEKSPVKKVGNIDTKMPVYN